MAALEKTAFFNTMEAQGLALTYDDVRLETGISQVAPSEVVTASRFSTNVEVKTPIISAAMDTVTTAPMAIAMAELGGLGIIHAGLTIDEQRKEVRRTKLHLNGRVDNPITVDSQQSVVSVLNMCEAKGFDFRTFPVIDESGKFVGLLTSKDFAFCADTSQAVHAVMTPCADIISSSADTSIADAYAQMTAHKKATLPLLNDDGTVAGLYVYSDVARIRTGNAGLYNTDAAGRLRVGAAIPTGDDAVERVQELLKYLDVAVIDTAQGDSKYAFQTLKLLKAAFPNLDVVIGNISSELSAVALVQAGADGIKVGQGPGSICTTRPETGIGCPQVTAVYQCVNAINKLKLPYPVPVCADGGIKDPGDISIAIAAGASTVMMGNLLAGTDEAPGVVMVLGGAMVKAYRGMGSPGALRDSAAARRRYGSDGTSVPLPEGIEGHVPYRGSVNDVMLRYIQALRKSMSYVGAPTIQDHQRQTRMYRITNAGISESRPHDVLVAGR